MSADAAVHLLVVGPPVGGHGVLRGPDPDARVTVLCSADWVLDWPDLREVDQLLAPRPPLEDPAQACALIRAGDQPPVTHVLSFVPRRHHQAARIADLLGVPVVPRFHGTAADPQLPVERSTPSATDDDAQTSFLVPVLAEAGELEPVGVISRTRRARGLVGHVLPADGLAGEDADELVATALTAVRATGLITGVALACCSSLGVHTPVRLPCRTVLLLLLLLRGSGIDLASSLVRQAFGLPTVPQLRSRRQPGAALGVIAAPHPPEGRSLHGLDAIEAGEDIAVETLPAIGGQEAQVLAWAWSGRPNSAADKAWRAMERLEAAEEGRRSWTW